MIEEYIYKVYTIIFIPKYLNFYVIYIKENIQI